jgi:uncharacterized protein with GYD domain
MGKYLLTGGYTAQSWKALVDHPTDRWVESRKVVEVAGGKLDSYFWAFGEDDFVAIIDAADDVTAAAISVAVGSSGALRNIRTTKLITMEESKKLLEKARTVAAAYSPPTAQPAGARR